jgi:hypothetical protein
MLRSPAICLMIFVLSSYFLTTLAYKILCQLIYHFLTNNLLKTMFGTWCNRAKVPGLSLPWTICPWDNALMHPMNDASPYDPSLVGGWGPGLMDQITTKTANPKGRLFLKIDCKEIWQQVFICLRPPPLREGVEVSGGEPVRRLEGSKIST